MRWSKIKNIIILMLVIVNLFLLGLVGLRVYRTRQSQWETGQRMKEVLANNGIEYTPGEVPGSLELTPRRVTVKPLGEGEAAALLDGPVIRARGGGAPSYQGEGGYLSLEEDGTVDLIYSGEGKSLEEVLAGLAKIGVSVKSTAQTAGELTLPQLWEGVPVPGRPVSLSLEGDKVRRVRLMPLAGTGEELSPPGEPITGPTALGRFLEALNKGGYVCSQVTGIYPGYSAEGEEAVTLTPAWYVETDTWPWRFEVAGYTGEVKLDW